MRVERFRDEMRMGQRWERRKMRRVDAEEESETVFFAANRKRRLSKLYKV